MNVTAALRALEGSVTQASPESNARTWNVSRPKQDREASPEASGRLARVECERGDPETGRPASVFGGSVAA